MSHVADHLLPKSGNNGNGGNQYCLKWNNHKLNISGVFERLRLNEQFCDLTLTSADQKFVKCHRILLCAGSGYLEEILTQNPSDHPTVILSQINYEELKLLVEFTYNGEVSVDSGKLAKLLEAAKILKIKGLWESESDEKDEEDEGDKEEDQHIRQSVCSEPEPQTQPQPLVGSKKRKRKSLPSPVDPKTLRVDEEGSPKSGGILTPKSESGNVKVYSPMFGVSNAYFLTAPEPPKAPVVPKVSADTENKSPSPQHKILNDLPNLTPIHPALISAITNASPMPFLPSLLEPQAAAESSSGNNEESGKTSKKSKKVKAVDKLNLTDASGRRYKQYTEETLQQALRDIMEGQSINRSSMKYNIPARTLRDWMKRLNIKSVFTHNHGSTSPSPSVSEMKAVRNMSTESDCSSSTGSRDGKSPPAVVDALPGMVVPMNVVGNLHKVDEDEEEIDDDEENV